MRVSRQNAALVESLLQGPQVLALTLTDDADDPVLEPGVGETPLWPSVCVSALFDSETPVDQLILMLGLIPGLERPQQVTVRKIDDQAWERVWLDRFKPMQFGAGLWIVPGDQHAPANASDILRLDPGLAFGTGTHPTTRLCLEWIDSHDFQGRSVVDFGCGSGVLGIAAAIKGANQVICVDNDPQALLASDENAIRNDVSDVIHTQMPDEYSAKPVDVLLANILAGPLIELAPLLLKSLHPGGTLVLSGILEEQANEVAQVYKPAIENLIITNDDGWVRLNGQKSKTPLVEAGVSAQ